MLEWKEYLRRQDKFEMYFFIERELFNLFLDLFLITQLMI